MHHPEPPEIGCSEMRSGMRQQPYCVKGWDRESREKEQPRHVAHVLRDESPAQSTKKNGRPKEKSDDQENLPEASQVEILKALISKPLPSCLNPTSNSRVFAQHAAKNNHCERYKQSICQPILSPGLAANDHWSQENPSGQEGRRDPENRQLKMPGARHVEGQHSAEIDTKKTREVGTIMLRGPAEQSLQQKK